MSDEQQAFIPAHTVDELPPHANWTGGSKYSRYFDGKVWALDYREFGLDSEERLRRSLVST